METVHPRKSVYQQNSFKFAILSKCNAKFGVIVAYETTHNDNSQWNRWNIDYWTFLVSNFQNLPAQITHSWILPLSKDGQDGCWLRQWVQIQTWSGWKSLTQILLDFWSFGQAVFLNWKPWKLLMKCPFIVNISSVSVAIMIMCGLICHNNSKFSITFW